MQGNKNRKELWAKLLSAERLHGKVYGPSENRRSEYERDYDRIIFSSAFRRLQDKTQVFPLSHTDFTRTRLTHSMEASCVARTLGVLAGRHLKQFGVECEPYDVGMIVAAAALAHDLGNPPFGHSGESAIQSWAKKRVSPPDIGEPITKPTFSARKQRAQSISMSAEEVADFHLFEGNAQGFRILVRTGARTNKGGLRPTIATLGAMAKYPRPSLVLGHEFSKESISEKKPGYFRHDSRAALKAFRKVGMVEKIPGVFCRHPLAFITEAADDICYAIADVEDGFKVGAVSFEEARDVILPVAGQDQSWKELTYLDKQSRLRKMRAAALWVLASECMNAFRDSLEELEAGKLSVPLIDRSKVSNKYQEIKTLAKLKVYRDERVLQIEYAGYQTIGGLLEMFYSALCECKEPTKDEKLRKMFPRDFLWQPGKKGRSGADQDDPVSFSLGFMTRYERLLAVTDYVSGMTDRFAVQLYQRLSGIRLPE